MNLEIALVRTINILRPFLNIRVLYLQLITVLYTAFLFAYDISYLYLSRLSQDARNRLRMDPFSFLKWHFYRPGGYQVLMTVESEHSEECATVTLLFCAMFLLPSFIVLCCMAIQV